MFVCPFPTDTKYWKTRVGFFFFLFFFDTLIFFVENKMSEYIVTVPKRYLNTAPSNTRIKPILRFCMLKNWHAWITLYFFYAQIRGKKLKKKIMIDLPSPDPPNFQTKRANKPFIFLGLMQVVYVIQDTSNDGRNIIQFLRSRMRGNMRVNSWACKTSEPVVFDAGRN